MFHKSTTKRDTSGESTVQNIKQKQSDYMAKAGSNQLDRSSESLNIGGL